ncbi:MAG: hypothetical protein J5802_08570 [Butyrivibrio sp.]|nr:hypothetical protein [Butyrivibrio sp.]
MLGTLIKYEFKATWMIMTLICGVLIGAGVVAGLVGNFLNLNSPTLTDMQELLLTFGVIGYAMLVSSLSMLSAVFLFVHYYRSLYTPQGYLSFTLPASITEVVSSRIIVGCIWTLASTLATFFSVSFTFMLSGNFKEIVTFIDEAYATIIEEVGAASTNLIIFEFILVFILSSISKMLMYDYSITVGQLWSKHKILGAVICYFATQFVMGIISFTGHFGLMFAAFESSMNFTMRGWITKNLLYSVFLCVAFYGVAIFVSNKKLNLD